MTGNTTAGECMALTYDWVKRVVDGQGMPEHLQAAGFCSRTGLGAEARARHHGSVM